MKKTIIIFLAILVGVFLVLSFIDKSDYALEKALWRVQKQLNQVAKDTKIVPDQKFDDIATQFNKLIEKYPDSKLTPGIYLKVGSTYVFKKDYNKARSVFNKILKLYPELDILCATTLFSIGNSFEVEGNMQEAVASYTKLYKDYPLTDLGMNSPMYIANYYLKNEMHPEYKSSLRIAVSLYEKISSESPNTPQEFNALRLLVTAYNAQKEWRQAVGVLEKLLIDYPTPPYLSPQRANLLIKFINTISMTQLRDYEVPIKIYQGFIAKYPNHSLNSVLTEMVSALKELQGKNVIVGEKKK